MSIVWGLIWGIVVFVVMFVTVKYYLPLLSKRIHASTSKAVMILAEDNTESLCEEEQDYNKFILNKRVLFWLTLVASACFAVWCGYAVASYSVTTLNMLKMLVTFAVLSCIFITDMELMIIPNLCSIVLLCARALTIVYEFIWLQELALAWLLNSVIAAIASLLLLLIMKKVTGGGLGMGDVKLFSSLGFLCGIQAVCYTLLLAFLLCAILSAVLLISKKKTLKDSLPLGPFIWLGYGIGALLSLV